MEIDVEETEETPPTEYRKRPLSSPACSSGKKINFDEIYSSLKADEECYNANVRSLL